MHPAYQSKQTILYRIEKIEATLGLSESTVKGALRRAFGFHQNVQDASLLAKQEEIQTDRSAVEIENHS